MSDLPCPRCCGGDTYSEGIKRRKAKESMREYEVRVAVPEWIPDAVVGNLLLNALEEVSVYLLHVEEA